MLYECSTLKNLSDISKWKTSNIIDMSYLFFNCSKIKELPDLSKWNSSNVIRMFKGIAKYFKMECW